MEDSTSLPAFDCSVIENATIEADSCTASVCSEITVNFSTANEAAFTSWSISAVIIFSVPLIVFPCALDSSASFRISSATTANPFPVSPAWAASIAAFIANRLVCEAIFSMTFEASSKPPDCSAIFCEMAFVSTRVFLPSIVADESI